MNSLVVTNGLVSEELDSYPTLEGPLSTVIEYLRREQELLQKTHSNLRLDKKYGYEGEEKMVIIGDRPATLQEQATQDLEDAEDKKNVMTSGRESNTSP